MKDLVFLRPSNCLRGASSSTRAHNHKSIAIDSVLVLKNSIIHGWPGHACMISYLKGLNLKHVKLKELESMFNYLRTKKKGGRGEQSAVSFMMHYGRYEFIHGSCVCVCVCVCARARNVMRFYVCVS